MRASLEPEVTPKFQLTEALLWAPAEGYYLLEEHLERLQDSAAHFGFTLALSEVRRQLADYARTLPPQPLKVRVQLAPDGRLTLAHQNVKPSTPVLVALADRPVQSGNVWLRHKTTNRAVYTDALAAHPEAQDVLLWNERGELTETCHANLVLEIQGRRLTPALSSGLLPGVFRRHLLESGEIQEQVLLLQSLEAASRLFLINSVRRWCDIHLVRHPAPE